MKKYLVEMMFGLTLALAIICACYATTLDMTGFIYHGF